MVPPRPSPKITIPPRPKKTAIQLNRTFDDEAEMNNWIAAMQPGAKVVRTWWIKQLVCEIELPEKKVEDKKGKKK